MDWDKLKKAIKDVSYIFGGIAILIACAEVIDYIALTHPVIAIFTALVILFCLLIVMFYSIS